MSSFAVIFSLDCYMKYYMIFNHDDRPPSSQRPPAGGLLGDVTISWSSRHPPAMSRL